MLKDYFLGLYKERYVIKTLVGSDLRTKYRNSYLGVAWSVLMPFGLAMIIGLVYSVLFGVSPREFIPMLFSGLNPWLFITGSADGGTAAFISAEGYIKQTAVHPQIFPVRMVTANFINLLYAVLAFLTFYLFMNPSAFKPGMLAVIPGLMIIYVFVLGMTNMSAVINLYIRDFQPVQAIFMQGMFFATPIVFQPEMLRAQGFSIVYQINPFYYMLEVVRTPLLGNGFASSRIYAVAISLAVIYFLISAFAVMKIRKKIAFKL